MKRVMAAVLAMLIAAPAQAAIDVERAVDQAERQYQTAPAPAAPKDDSWSTKKKAGVGLLAGGGALIILGATKDTSGECTTTSSLGGVKCETSSGGGLMVAGALLAVGGVVLLLTDTGDSGPMLGPVPKGVQAGYRLKF